MKTCPRCKCAKPHDAFGRNKAKKDGLQVQCKECTKGINRDYYLRTPEKNPARRAFAEERREQIRDWLANYLATHPCVDCGNSDIRVLEFDHVRGKKEFSLSLAPRKGVAQDRLEAEVAKCEIRCANCHRIATGERDGRWHRHLAVAA